MDPNTPGGFGGQPPPQQGWPQQQQQQPPQATSAGDAPFASAKASGYVPNDEEKQQAFYAHLFAAGAMLVLCGFGGVVGALVPMFMAKQKTPFMMYHVNQSFWFQAGLLVVNVMLATVFAIVAAVTCGIGGLLYLVNGVLVLVAIGYPIMVGMKAKEGEWSEYAVVGAKILAQKSPIFK